MTGDFDERETAFGLFLEELEEEREEESQSMFEVGIKKREDVLER